MDLAELRAHGAQYEAAALLDAVQAHVQGRILRVGTHAITFPAVAAVESLDRKEAGRAFLAQVRESMTASKPFAVTSPEEPASVQPKCEPGA